MNKLLLERKNHHKRRGKASYGKETKWQTVEYSLNGFMKWGGKRYTQRRKYSQLEIVQVVGNNFQINTFQQFYFDGSILCYCSLTSDARFTIFISLKCHPITDGQGVVIS